VPERTDEGTRRTALLNELHEQDHDITTIQSAYIPQINHSREKVANLHTQKVLEDPFDFGHVLWLYSIRKVCIWIRSLLRYLSLHCILGSIDLRLSVYAKSDT
jgi:hypothetical protein